MTVPDLILRGGLIHRLDGSGGVDQAMAVSGGRIVWVGAEDQAPAPGPQTEVVNLEGRTVLPGLVDSHTHCHDAALTAAYMLDFQDPPAISVTQVLARVADRARDLLPGEWIQGKRLVPETLGERRFPTLGELDAVSPRNPVFLLVPGNHAGVANSAALHLAGVDQDTPNPIGGIVERDPVTGELSGVLQQQAIGRLDIRRPGCVIPAFTMEQRKRALLRAFTETLLPCGITAVHDIVTRPDEVQAYKELAAEGRLPLRVVLLARVAEAQLNLNYLLDPAFTAGLDGPWLQLGGAKLSVDGVEAHRAAALYQPYPGEPENYGLVRIPQPELDDLVLQAQSARIRLAIHAIGDRGLDMALSALERAESANPWADSRHRIEHLGNLPVTGEQVRRALSLGVIASAQPSFLSHWGDQTLAVLGAERLSGVFPLRTLMGAGLVVQGNSDWPYTPPDPWAGIATAMDRRTLGGQLLAPEESLDFADALRLFTSAPAYAEKAEREAGYIALGCRADLTIVDRDPFGLSSVELPGLGAAMTIVGGQVGHRDF